MYTKHLGSLQLPVVSWWACLCLLNLYILVNGEIMVGESPQVIIKNGELRGKWMTSRENRTYCAFEGIPYANVSKRYFPPEPQPDWEGVKNVTEPGPMCPQFDFLGQQISVDENCLFMNVYVPMNDNGTGIWEENLPVFFWLHGGGFLIGTGSAKGAQYMMDQKIILITINYRMGNFGFLSLGERGDGLMSENNALRDMIEALTWTQTNIHYFGGDPKSVTIGGQSAGGVAVGALLLSPRAKNLFHKAILQSGPVLGHWTVQKNPLENAQKFAEYAGCSKTKGEELDWDYQAMMECLREKSPLELVMADLALFGQCGFLLAPSIDSPRESNIYPSILPDTLRNLMTKHSSYENSATVPIICGRNADEALGTALGIFADPQTVNELNSNWNEKLVELLHMDYLLGDKEKAMVVAEQARSLYIGNDVTIISSDSFIPLVKLSSDYGMDWSVREIGVWHAQVGAPVYSYVLNYQGEFSMINLSGYPTQGVTHSDELQYLFDSPMMGGMKMWPDLVVGTKDGDFSQHLVSTWASFIQTGVPQSWGETWVPLAFNVTNNEVLDRLRLEEIPEMETEDSEFLKRMQFWTPVFNTGQNYTRMVKGRL